jgi:hypothetical protein
VSSKIQIRFDRSVENKIYLLVAVVRNRSCLTDVSGGFLNGLLRFNGVAMLAINTIREELLETFVVGFLSKKNERY